MPKIIQFILPPGGTQVQVADNVEVALDIETTAGEDFILIDSETGAENMVLCGANFPVLVGSNQRGPRLRDGHGSSAVPSFPVYTFRGDTNTGMTHLGTGNDDTVVLVAGGVEGFRVSESGDTARPQTIGSVATALTDNGGTASVSTSGSSTALVGVNTAFTTDFHVGAAIKVGSVITTVTAITDDNNLTLEDSINTSSTGTTCTRDGGELFAVKTGDSQTAFAVNASGAMTFGTKPGSEDSSIAIGDGDALDTLTTGKSNVIIGHASDNYKLTTGKRHIFIGYRAGEDITTTDNNVFIGFEGAQAATGANNVFVGAEVAKNATGSDCVAIGKGTMMNCTGTDSVAIGASALDGSADSDQCVAIGSLSLSSNNSASANGNVALGYAAMFSCESGSNNVAVGRNVAGAIRGAQNCVVIGKDANVSGQDVDNEIVIGKGGAGNGSNTITLGNSSISAIHCQVQSISALSDSRIKDNVQDSALGLDFINALRPVKYEMKHPSEYPEEIRPAEYTEQTLTRTRRDDDGNDVEFTETIEAETKPEGWQPTTEYGLIAQEVRAVMESQNATDWQGHRVLPNGAESLGYGYLVPVLVKAVQELSARLAVLESGE